jgi:hypothetical protein
MKRISVLSMLALLLSACTENSSVQPPTPPFDPFADCGNGDPVSAHDSTYKLWPYPMYTISQLRISSYNGWWAGDYLRFRTSEESTFAMGVFIYDPVNDTPIAQFDEVWGHRLSPDGRSLILMQGFRRIHGDVTTHCRTHRIIRVRGSRATAARFLYVPLIQDDALQHKRRRSAFCV